MSYRNVLDPKYWTLGGDGEVFGLAEDVGTLSRKAIDEMLSSPTAIAECQALLAELRRRDGKGTELRFRFHEEDFGRLSLYWFRDEDGGAFHGPL